MFSAVCKGYTYIYIYLPDDEDNQFMFGSVNEFCFSAYSAHLIYSNVCDLLCKDCASLYLSQLYTV